MSTQPFGETVPYNVGSTANNAAGTTVHTLVPAAVAARRIDAIIVTSTETVARVVDFIMQIGGSNYVTWSVSIPAGAGYGGVAPVNALASLQTLFPNAVALAPADSIAYAMETTITSPLTILIVAMGGTL